LQSSKNEEAASNSSWVGMDRAYAGAYMGGGDFTMQMSLQHNIEFKLFAGN
jgi:hypothetical protein